MNKIVNLRRVGKFYQAYEDDAYVIHAIMGYNVSNGRIGFPINSLGKVQNKLEECKVRLQIKIMLLILRILRIIICMISFQMMVLYQWIR